MDMLNLLKPGPFKIKEDGNPEELLQRFELYVERFQSFLTATEAAGRHTAGHVPEAGGGTCKGCVKAKEILKLVGDVQMSNLFKHVGNVQEGDSFEEALEKVRAGIKRQTNQASARFKLYISLQAF